MNDLTDQHADAHQAALAAFRSVRLLLVDLETHLHQDVAGGDRAMLERTFAELRRWVATPPAVTLDLPTSCAAAQFPAHAPGLIEEGERAVLVAPGVYAHDYCAGVC